MFTRSLWLYPTPRGIHCHRSTSMCSNLGNVAAGKGYDHVSAGLEYPRGSRVEIDRDPKGLSRRYDMTSLQTVPCHIAGMMGLLLALSCWKKKLVSNSLINLQDMLMKDFICITWTCK